MEEIMLIIQKLDIPTCNLSSTILQSILIMVQKLTKTLKTNDHNSHCNEELLKKAADLLWFHLEVNITKIDDQLLCATCFYNILNILNIKEEYYKQIIKEINIILTNYSDDNNILFVISLLYGVFQSSLLSNGCEYNILIRELLYKSLDLLIVKAYEYTQYTFVIFKIIASYKKIHETGYEENIFDFNNKIKLLNLVCHNWENPIAGIRDLNKDIFQMILYVCENMIPDILEEINNFTWNKAKYFMLTEIITYDTNTINNILMLHSEWIDGIVDTLFKPGLVSAGADMYSAILKKVKSEEEWQAIFLDKIITVLNSGSFKAKENFINYWCLNTFKVYPGILMELYSGIILLNKHNLHSSLGIMKQGNRIGIVEKKWDSRNDNFINTLILGSQDIDPYVRMASFDIICISHGTTLPSHQEYNLIYRFLVENVNSDCTVLRISMLNSLRLFLNRLHLNYLHALKQEQSLYEKTLYEFCVNIQKFIKQTLTIGGNYQRKLTIIKLCSIFMTSISDIPSKRNEKKIDNSKSLIQKLKDVSMWYLSDQCFINNLLSLLNDPAEDIKQSVVQLLHNYYYQDLINLKLVDEIIKSAQNSIKSRFFFEISSGYSKFNLVTNLFVKFNARGQNINTVEDLFTNVCKELIVTHKSGVDIVTLIEEGKQLHAFITVLNTIFQVCLQNNYALDKMLTEDEICTLLETLEQLSIQFVEENTEGNSDFSKINDIINVIIDKSGNKKSFNDITKISGLQQIILNAMWLNVKSSCELSSTLVKCYTQHEKYKEMCRKCLNIIANVLETCRHKGAIEAAGVALGQSIQHLTSQPAHQVSKIADDFLQQKVNTMINEANQLTSVTRRGAGLSIMIHRLVSSDMRKGKPLFHFFMKKIIEACTRNDNISNEINDNTLDLPKAIYIHLLTKVVIDSSLASDSMFYSSELAKIAFDNLRNDKWQIRNAALQLYGALIPKLIGQKKCASNDEESIATVAFDEFRVHSPKLWIYIQEQINTTTISDILQSHSNLVPILNLLSSCAKRYNFSYDLKTQYDGDMILLNSLMRLLNSPIFTVRYLTSNSIFKMYPFETICSSILNNPPTTENCLNGYLMLTKICFKNYYYQCNYSKQFENLKEFFKPCLSNNNSYLSKSLYYEMFVDLDLNDLSLKIFFDELNLNKHAPGVFTWLNTIIYKLINSCEIKQLPEICDNILNFGNIDTYCDIIKKRLFSETVVPTNIFKDITAILFIHNRIFESSTILQLLYEISKKSMTVFDNDHISELFNYLEQNNYNVDNKLRYIIPLAAQFITHISNANISKFMLNVLSLSNIEHENTEIRYLTSLTNNEFGVIFQTLPDDMKILSLTATIILLQDEDEEIRYCTTQFIQNITKNENCLQPYVCLNILLDIKFLQRYLIHNCTILELCKRLESLLDNINKWSETKDSYNPFASDYKNIYFENTILKDKVAEIKHCLGAV